MTATDTRDARENAMPKHLTIRCQFCDTWNRIDAARAADRPKCGKCGKPMLLDRPLKLDDETFARTIAESQIPVLVDFYADWCGPCKMMTPFVDELAREQQGAALIAKLDTDRAQRTAQQFDIRGIPTTIVFKGGKEVARQSGAMPKPGLQALLARA
ncbi:MAG TPA: thioredoxin [Gemmatimonadaceae bacterium]|nr:thioredoxin [Gemmatimonadaceae bacterium]